MYRGGSGVPNLGRWVEGYVVVYRGVPDGKKIRRMGKRGRVGLLCMGVQRRRVWCIKR